MQVHLARSLEEIPFSPAKWNDLVRNGSSGTIFQTYEWFECWWQIFGMGRRLLLITLFEHDRLAGFAPLVSGTGLRRRGWLSFAGDTHADYIDIVARPSLNARVVAALLEALAEESSWSVLSIRNLPTSSPTLKQLKEACAKIGLSLRQDSEVICPTLLVHGRESEVNSLARKYRLRRAANYFKRQGNFRIRDIKTVEEARRYLPIFFDQHIQRWRGTATSSLFLKAENRAFYTRLVERLLPEGWLLFTVAEVDGRSISFHFGFDFGGRVFWYKPAFERTLAKHSPGTILIKHLVDYSLASGREELDFTIGGEPFKQRYTNMARTNVNLRIFRHNRHYVMARSYGAAKSAARRLRRGSSA